MTEARTADDVWRLLGELLQAQQETEHRFQETERLLKEQAQETERLLKEQARQLTSTSPLESTVRLRA